MGQTNIFCTEKVSFLNLGNCSELQAYFFRKIVSVLYYVIKTWNDTNIQHVCDLDIWYTVEMNFQ